MRGTSHQQRSSSQLQRLARTHSQPSPALPALVVLPLQRNATVGAAVLQAGGLRGEEDARQLPEEGEADKLEHEVVGRLQHRRGQQTLVSPAGTAP